MSQVRLSEGHYAKKQLLSKDWLISWSHRSRFAMGLKLAHRLRAKRVLDYGCGDGSFLAMLMNGQNAPASAVGAEISHELIEDCRQRLGRPSLGFVLTEELNTAEHAAAYDLVACMEVLEHVVEVSPLLDKLWRLVAPEGRLLISVPVETGLPLLVKQAARRIAGWRGIGDYPGTSSYTLSEYVSSVFAGRRQHLTRPVHVNPDGTRFHDHKGFNWMAMRARLRQQFELEQTYSSPLQWPPPHLASQAWFVLRKKA